MSTSSIFLFLSFLHPPTPKGGGGGGVVREYNNNNIIIYNILTYYLYPNTSCPLHYSTPTRIIETWHNIP